MAAARNEISIAAGGGGELAANSGVKKTASAAAGWRRRKPARQARRSVSPGENLAGASLVAAVGGSKLVKAAAAAASAGAAAKHLSSAHGRRRGHHLSGIGANGAQKKAASAWRVAKEAAWQWRSGSVKSGGGGISDSVMAAASGGESAWQLKRGISMASAAKCAAHPENSENESETSLKCTQWRNVAWRMA